MTGSARLLLPGFVLLAAIGAGPLDAQAGPESPVGRAQPATRDQHRTIAFHSTVTLYGDNTEFFTPYREGETIFGGQFDARLVGKPAGQFAIHAGVFGDVRWGSEEFLDRVKPILAFRYETATSLGVLGTLETIRRHGLVEPLAVTTLELTRPVEYGLQWRERRRRWQAEVYLNWQAINTVEQPEAFDYAGNVRVTLVRPVSLLAQLHGLHHGGQLSGAVVPVTNNVASGLGVELADSIGSLGLGRLAFFRLSSRGKIDPNAPPDRPTRGHGTYLRAGFEPRQGLELFGIYWRGRDFLSQEGDNNYNSAGFRSEFYRSRRKYFELGILRRGTLSGGVELDAEFRLHRIDDLESEALFDSRWEYSYRLVVRSPFSFPLHMKRGSRSAKELHQ